MAAVAHFPNPCSAELRLNSCMLGRVFQWATAAGGIFQFERVRGSDPAPRKTRVLTPEALPRGAGHFGVGNKEQSAMSMTEHTAEQKEHRGYRRCMRDPDPVWVIEISLDIGKSWDWLAKLFSTVPEEPDQRVTAAELRRWYRKELAARKRDPGRELEQAEKREESARARERAVNGGKSWEENCAETKQQSTE